MNSERRKYERYLVPRNTFTTLGQNFSPIGRVKEMSLGGVGIEYISDQKPLGIPIQVEIFLSDNGFHLSGLPCRVVYDLPLSPPAPTNDSPFITKKCGLAFGELVEHQTAQLKLFLETKNLGLSI